LPYQLGYEGRNGSIPGAGSEPASGLTQDFFVDDEDSIFEKQHQQARRIWDHSGM